MGVAAGGAALTRFPINTGGKRDIREDVNPSFNFTTAAWEGWEEFIL